MLDTPRRFLLSGLLGLLGALLPPGLLAGCGPSEPAAPAASAAPKSAASAEDKPPPATTTARPSPGAPAITVAAAASLRELCEGTAQAFSAGHDSCKVSFSFDASSSLARQIGEGAGFDVFISADAANLDKVKGSIDEATRRNVLGNKLVMVVRGDLDSPPKDPAGLKGNKLSIAVAGEAVPAGKYARACLKKLGLLEELEPRFVNGSSVTATLGLVDSGAADVGFVYVTDVHGAKTTKLMWTAPPEADPGIVYVAAALKNSSSPCAKAYVEWLGSEEFVKSAKALGFLPPP